MTALADALEVFSGLTKDGIDAVLTAANIDIVSVCKGNRSQNCPFAVYLSGRIGDAVIVTSDRAYTWDSDDMVYLDYNVQNWIADYDKADIPKARLLAASKGSA